MPKMPGSERPKHDRLKQDEWRPEHGRSTDSGADTRAHTSADPADGQGGTDTSAAAWVGSSTGDSREGSSAHIGAEKGAMVGAGRHVAIVGAGFAGMRCADVLCRQGYRVSILEARGRVGGRVAQSDALGHRVDLGPNWIHGTSGNPIQRLAEQTSTRLHDWREAQAVYARDGTRLSDDEAGLYARLMWDGETALVPSAFRHSNDSFTASSASAQKQKADPIPASSSLYDYFSEQVSTLFRDGSGDSVAADRRRAALLDYTRLWGAYVGSPVERQSLRFFWLEECVEGENPFVAETYAKICDEVSRAALSRADLRLNTKVVRIEHGLAGGKVGLTIDGSAASAREEFDEVVVTAPLGWLKRNLDAFEPALETRLVQAVGNIGYGCLDKVYFTFPRAFWNETRGSSNSTENDDSEGFPPFALWLPPEYTGRPNAEQWDVSGINLAALPDTLAHPTLLFYIQGPCAQYIAQLVHDNPEPKAQHAALTAFFEPFFSRLPNYSASAEECAPSAVLATAWANDELAGYGSYSNFQVGLEEGDKDIETMRKGMPESGLWFAGEHTAPFVALGTTTGAYWSGEKVAERIVAKHSAGDKRE